jgi:hypothetical protein
VHGKHRIHFDGARVEIPEQGYKQYVLEILWVSGKVAHIFDDSTEKNYPEGKNYASDQLHVVLEMGGSLPEQA